MKAFKLLLVLPVAFLLPGCALAPVLISGIPSLIGAIEPIIQRAQDKAAAKAKAQTALNLLQDVNNGQFPSELEINLALANAGKRCLHDGEYVQIRDALTPAFQQLVLDAQARPGGYEMVKRRVSDAIVATQKEIAYETAR